MFRFESKAQSEKLQPLLSSIRRADRDDLHLADGMIHPPNDGMNEVSCQGSFCGSKGR
jgi:hypothetical protein